jgi:hypothetical protein
MSSSSSSHDAADHDVAARHVSPELALVSSEVADVERSKLPSKPWEVPRSERPMPPRAGLHRPTDSSTARSRSRRRTLTVPAVVVAAGLLLLLAGLMLDSSSNGPAPSDVGSSTAKGKASGRSKSTPDRQKAASPALDGGQAGVGKPQLQPRGGYVVSPRGSLFAQASGRAIETFVLPLACGGQPLVLSDLPVTGRSFDFVGKADTGQKVRLHMRVVDRSRISGVVTATGRDCPAAGMRFQARLS